MFHEGRQKGIDHSLYTKWHNDGSFKKMIEGDKIYSSPDSAGDGLRENTNSARKAFENERRKLGKELQNKDGMLHQNHFMDWQTQSAASAPTAKDVDLAHQATGVPSLGAEATNFVRASRL